MGRTSVSADIAVIKNQILNLSNDFKEFKDDNKKFYNSTNTKMNTLENKQTAIGQKVSLMAGFQSIFSIVIGGIATYLGSRQ